VEEIYTPAFIAQSVHDEIINPESAHYIKEHLASDEKKLKWFHQSGHVVTTGPEREELHEDIYMFLENLNRSEEHTSELQSRFDLVCRLLLEKKKAKKGTRGRNGGNE